MLFSKITRRYIVKVNHSVYECGNLKVVVDSVELTRNINKKKKPDVLQAYTCPLCDKC